METNLTKNDLNLNSAIQTNLETTRKWAMFIAIVGFVFMALIVIFGFSLGSIMNSVTGEDPLPGFSSFFLGFIYLIFGLIYFFPLLYLFRFAKFTKKGVQEMDQRSFELAFDNLKSHYTYIGVLLAIIMGLYVFMGLIFAVVTLVT